MTDKITSLLPELLRPLQAAIARLQDSFADVAAELRALKAHMGAFLQAEARQDDDIASLQQRLDRIERRLDQRD